VLKLDFWKKAVPLLNLNSQRCWLFMHCKPLLPPTHPKPSPRRKSFGKASSSSPILEEEDKEEEEHQGPSSVLDREVEDKRGTMRSLGDE